MVGCHEEHPAHKKTPFSYSPEQVEEEDLKSKGLTQVYLKKQPLNRIVSSSFTFCYGC